MPERQGTGHEGQSSGGGACVSLGGGVWHKALGGGGGPAKLTEYARRCFRGCVRVRRLEGGVLHLWMGGWGVAHPLGWG